MDNQFINCPNCGIRNFVEDKFCGVCNTKLPVVANQAIQNQAKEKSTNWKAILLIICGILFFYFAFIKENEKGDNSSQEIYSDNSLENSPEMQLAIINDNTKTPQQTTITLFNNLLTSLSNIYSNRSKQQITNTLISSHNIILKYGHRDSLLEFTTAFEAYSKEIDKNYNLTIEQSLAIFVKIAYQI